MESILLIGAIGQSGPSLYDVEPKTRREKVTVVFNAEFRPATGLTRTATGCGNVLEMIVGCGVDIIEIARIDDALARYGDRFCRRIYLPEEIRYCNGKRNAAESFAARFAAKEAAAKALGTGIQAGVGWQDIEVLRAPSGRPTLMLHGRAAELAKRLGVTHSSISLTHSRTEALAQVFLEK